MERSIKFQWKKIPKSISLSKFSIGNKRLIFEIFFYSFLREELEVTDEMGEDIDLADLVPKVYEPISSWDVLQTKLMDSMNKMNEEIRGSNMDLVFFKDQQYILIIDSSTQVCIQYSSKNFRVFIFFIGSNQ